MIRILFFILFLGISTSNSFAQTWGKQLNSIASYNSGKRTIIDKYSNVYVFENYRGPSSQRGCVFQKYDSTGTLLWSKSIVGFSITAVVNLENKIVTAGQLTGNLAINQASYFGNGNTNLFLSFDFEGNCTWAKSIGEAFVYSLKSDNTGHVYICGSFQGTCTFDSESISQTYQGQRDFFLAKCDSSCVFEWVNKAEGGIFGTIGDLAINGNDIYVTAHYILPIKFGSGSLSQTLTTDGTSILLAKFDNTGQFKWAKQVSNGGECEARSINADQSGNLYVVGWYSMAAKFGNVSLSCQYRNGFVAKFNTTGAQQWVKQAEGYSGYIYNVVLSDRIYAVGSFEKNGSYYYQLVFGLDGNEVSNLSYSGSSSYFQIIANDIAWYDGKMAITGEFFGDVQMGNIAFSKAFAGPDRAAFLLFFNEKKIEGVKEERQNVLAYLLMPNPNNGIFTIKGRGNYTEQINVWVIDELGRVVMHCERCFETSNELEIDLNKQGKGVYFVKIVANKETTVNRVVCY